MSYIDFCAIKIDGVDLALHTEAIHMLINRMATQPHGRTNSASNNYIQNIIDMVDIFRGRESLALVMCDSNLTDNTDPKLIIEQFTANHHVLLSRVNFVLRALEIALEKRPADFPQDLLENKLIPIAFVYVHVPYFLVPHHLL